MNPAIRRDTDDTADDGCIESVNVRFLIDGEYRRRQGMELGMAVSSLSLGTIHNSLNGRYALSVTSTGDLEATSV